MKNMKTVDTYTSNIYVGLREGYTSILHSLNEVKTICKEYVNNVKLCVTITPTEFIYVDGSEPGVIIGLINYPRFPSDIPTIRKHAEDLAKIFLTEFKQQRISIVFPDKTLMLEQ